MPIDDEKPATAGQLRAVETKLQAEIHGVETRLQTEIQAVETRLQAKLNTVAVQVVNNQTELKALRRDMATKDDIQRVITAIDHFANKQETYDRETVFFPRTLDAHGESLRDHENWIKALEAPRQGGSPR